MTSGFPIALIKILSDEWHENLDVRLRFLDEARPLRKIDSDRVVLVYDIGNSLAAIVRWVDRSQHRAAGHLAKAVRVIPGVVAAIPSALITLGWSAGLLS